jgi:hypothetical protein
VAFHTEKEGFPPIPLTAGMKIRLEAIDPTTGAAVGGVQADRWAIYGEDLSEPPPDAVEPTQWLDTPFSH